MQDNLGNTDHALTRAAYWRRDVMQAAEHNFVIGFRIVPFDSRCFAKEDYAGCYKLADVPPMPHPYCTGEFCNCMGWAIFDNETPQSPWRQPPTDVGTFWQREGVPCPGAKSTTPTMSVETKCKSDEPVPLRAEHLQIERGIVAAIRRFFNL